MQSIEICAGAGGQALGLEQAGFEHNDLVEYEPAACSSLRLNRPQWNVIEGDVRNYTARHMKGVDLVAGGVPCPPFSHAGKQLGADDERDLFPEALRLVAECKPQAVMLENVRGLLDPVFDDYRSNILLTLKKLGYEAEWKLLQAADFGVPQLRPRSILVALKRSLWNHFEWPVSMSRARVTVGEALHDLMAARGWKGASLWKDRANTCLLYTSPSPRDS